MPVIPARQVGERDFETSLDYGVSFRLSDRDPAARMR